jgi:CDP-paratose 2-epimerase
MIRNAMTVLITGSAGLVGSVTAQFFLDHGHQVVGIDNNMRKFFFGNDGSTEETQHGLVQHPHYHHFHVDIRNKEELHQIFSKYSFDAIIHTAGQPSHDKAKDIPLIDFEVNALGTLQLLQLTKEHCPNAVFIFTSTNKVYGDKPNQQAFKELKSRYWFKDKNFKGFNESLSIDQSTHSLFGCSKLAADMYVQEYGRYFGLKTIAIRLGCITGGNHAGVKLHGFLSYLVKSLLSTGEYTIIGYKGKQVRDQIHAYDLATAFTHIIKKPKKGAVYNLGGGIDNTASVLELIETIRRKTNRTFAIKYEKKPRVGDHICYVTNYDRFTTDYPRWKITKSLNAIIDEHIESVSKQT